MPLWMQGALELLLAAVFSYLAVVLMLVAIWYTNGFNNRDLQGVISLSGNIWLLTHSVPLHLDIPHQGMVPAISGTMAYTPLGFTLLPLVLCFLSGRKLARASYEGQFWVPLTGGLVAYSLFAAGVSYFSGTDSVSTGVLAAALLPLWVVALGVIGGGLYESRSLSGMIGVNAADSVRKYSQYSRWAGSYLWALVRASFIAPLALLAGGALLLGVSIFFNWNDILAMYQALHAGAVGDTAITFLQLGIIPNLLVYAMSYSTGAGFALGTGSSIDWSGADVGALPLLPVLGAIPVMQEPFSTITVAVPLLAGVLAGWWFFREGENHLDEWLSLKIGFRPVSWLLSHLCLALAMGLLSGLWVGLLGWVAEGSLGLGKFVDIGPNPLLFGLFAAAWFALGIVTGSLLGRLVEKDAKAELARESDDVVLVRATTAPQQPKKRFGVRRQKSSGDTREGTDANGEQTLDQVSPNTETKLKVVKEPALRRSNSADALHTILGDDKDAAPAEEKKAAEVPWWEKNTRKQAEPAPESEKQQAGSDTEASPAEEVKQGASAASDSDQPSKPRLSRGRVIRRPKAKKKNTEE